MYAVQKSGYTWGRGRTALTLNGNFKSSHGIDFVCLWVGSNHFSNEETGRKESSLTTKRFMPEIMETAWTKAVLSRGCNEEGN